MVNKLDKLDKLNESKIVFALILIIVFLSMLLLNRMTFYRSDDFALLLQIQNTSGASIFDTALKCTISIYENWTGRFNLFWTFLFMQLDKSVFDVFNSFFYLLLIYLLHTHILGNFKINNFNLICVSVMAWFFISSFGNVILWLTASPEYLWTVVFCLILLLPLRMYYQATTDKKNNILLLIAIVPLSVLSAGGMETIGGTALLINIMFIISISLKKGRVPAYSIISSVIIFITLCVSVFSPGTRYRSTVVPNSNPLIEIAKRLYLQLYNIDVNFTLIIVVLLFALVLYATHGVLPTNKPKPSKNILRIIAHIDKNTTLILIFLLAAFVSEMSLILSPYIAGRQNIFTICCIIVAIGTAGINLDKTAVMIKNFKWSLICVLVFLCVSGYTVTLAQTYNAYTMQRSNINNIELNKSKGIYDDIEIRYTTLSNSHMAYSSGDLDSHNYILPLFCEYYGINSIVMMPNDAQ